MKQWSYSYHNKQAFAAFVDQESIHLYKEVLIQINTASVDTMWIQEMQQAIIDLIPQAHIIGGSGRRQLHDGKIITHQTILGISAFEKSRIESFAFTLHDTYPADILRRLLEFDADDARGLLLYSNALTFDLEKLLRLSNQTLKGLPIFGGIISGSNKKLLLFSKEEIYAQEALLGVFFYGNALNIHCRYFFDWEPIGKVFTVTKASGRSLYTLDHRSLLQTYSKYFGPISTKDLLELVMAYPLMKSSKDFGIVTRALLRIDPKKGFFTGAFNEGEEVQISFGSYERMIRRYETQMYNKTKIHAEAVWVYVCLAYECGYLDILQAAASIYTRPSALFGMMSFGEFCPAGGMNRFLNHTFVRVTLSEDPKASIALRKTTIPNSSKDRLLQTLSTLVANSSQEIIALNRYLEKEVAKRTNALAKLNASLEKRIEIEVKKNAEKERLLYHQSKLASMGEMINNIAHQWRQPLHIVALIMQDLSLQAQLGTVDLEAIIKAEKKVSESLRYLSDTIEDFRSFFSEERSQDSATFLVSQAIQETIRLASVKLNDEKVSLVLSLPPHEMVIKGRANDLKQVLLNLIYNSIDAFKERAIPNPSIKIEVKHNTLLHIIVRDNAGGIAPDIIDHIFEPYFTTKYQSRGTGLGLYMSKMIIEKRLHGTIRVQNRRKGASFWIALPFIQDDKKTLEPESPSHF